MRIISNRGRILPVIVMAAMLVAGMAVAQPGPGGDQGPEIDKETKAAIIDSVSRTLADYYVYPATAKKMAEAARKEFKDGGFDDAKTTGDFAMKLTETMMEVCQDRHFGIRYAPKERIEMMLDTVNQPSREEQLREARRNNFGFKEVKQLPGNIGYLKFDGFSGFREAGNVAVGAMQFLANSDALIIDLRENGGGSPSMIQIITSYFFEDPTHLNTFYVRETDSLQQFWTTKYVDGEKMTDVPIYVLTSNYTFSAAEEFTYNLKNLKRATVVGETTGGGAHPVDMHAFPNLQIVMRVPFGKAINPVTGDNWEGRGIAPHIACAADEALDVAVLEAMKELKEKTEDPQLAARYEWDIANKKALLHPVQLNPDVKREYVGDYGPRHINLINGNLIYERDERQPYEMTPMGDDTFCFEAIDYFRLRFVRDDAGRIVAVEGHYDNGRVDRNDRN